MQTERETGKGVGLADKLLALLLAAAGAGGLLGTVISVRALSENARQTAAALDDLHRIMLHVEATPFGLLGREFPDGVADGGLSNDYEAVIGGYTLHDERITISYPRSEPHRREITATVEWLQRGRKRTLSLASFRSSG